MPIIPIYYSVETDSIHLTLKDAIDAQIKADKQKRDEQIVSELMYKFECLRQDYNDAVGDIRNKYKAEFDKLLCQFKSLNVDIDLDAALHDMHNTN